MAVDHEGTESAFTQRILRLQTTVSDAYEQMEMSVQRYLIYIVLPAIAMGVVLVSSGFFIRAPIWMRLPLPLLGVLIAGSALYYPRIAVNNRKLAIEKRLHLVITHMTVLSTTNIDRMTVFRTLGQEEEYGELAVEINRIVHYVDAWNRSLDDACHRRAKEVPSRVYADFLDRLAYSINAGQELKEFLLNEQNVIIQNYVTVYESTLANLEVMKDLYLSMILSMTFALVFAIVLPILTGTDPALTVAAVLVMFAFVQLGFLLVVRTMVPHDPVWYYPDHIRPRNQTRLTIAIVVGAVLSVIIVLFLVLDMLMFGFGVATRIPEPLLLAVPLTPLLFSGLIIRAEENRIINRDGEFPSFIRALGASESAKQSTTSRVLSTLREKDFGSLTREIDELYMRLNMRLDQPTAWRHFSADCRSYLIQKFSEMYLLGRQLGGDPKQLGELISQNMNEVNQLRQQRKQSAMTMIGVLYGITAASVFAFFIAMEVVTILSNMSLGLNEGDFGANLIHTEVYNIPMIRYLLYLVILFNALISALMIRTIDGGNLANAGIHFVVLTWVSSVTAVVTTRLVGSFLQI